MDNALNSQPHLINTNDIYRWLPAAFINVDVCRNLPYNVETSVTSSLDKKQYQKKWWLIISIIVLSAPRDKFRRNKYHAWRQIISMYKGLP